jgi:predicted transcriptional regulator
MTTHDEVLDLLQLIAQRSPCDTTELAQAMGLEPQEMADRLVEAGKTDYITAQSTPGGTTPYLVEIGLTANGQAALHQFRGQ